MRAFTISGLVATLILCTAGHDCYAQEEEGVEAQDTQRPESEGEQESISTTALLVRLLERLERAAVDSARREAAILELSRRLDQVEGGEHKVVAKRGYGSGSHIWTNRTAACPEGSHVSGIEVVYRGTCLNQCDADGGIIGDIILICAE